MASSPKRKSRRKSGSKNGKPTDMALYNRVKAQAKRKFKVWPSAYASGWLVKEYKRRGGKYSGKKPGKTQGLDRWFKEKWVNVCKSPPTTCGRPTTNLSEWKKKYPYCRPSKRISSATPKTVSQLSKAEIARRCKTKRKSPMKRVMPKKSKSRRKSKRKKSLRKSRKKSRRKSRSKRKSKSRRRKSLRRS